MKTYNVTPKDIDRKWVTVDASGKTVGRLATEISRVLRGKHKATFVPHLKCGDKVIVVNAKDAVLTGNKLEQKFYYKYTGFIGGLKSISAKDQLDQHPDRVIRSAVKGMLPKNKLAKQLMRDLRIFSGAEHNLGAQKPEPMATRS